MAGSRLGWLDLALVWLDLVGFRLGFGRIRLLAFIYFDFLLDFGLIRLGLGLDFALPFAFIRIVCYSSLS